MNEAEFAELAAGHSLGALSRSDEQRYDAALAAHPEWADSARDDEATAALLSEGVAEVAPPAGIRGELLAQIAHMPQGQPFASPVLPASARGAADRRPRRLLFTLAACLILVAGLGIAASMVIPQLLRPAAVVALENIESAPDAAQRTVDVPSGGTATAHWSASSGEAVLVVKGLQRLDEAKTYELWFVRGETPVSAGVFSAADGTTTAELKGRMHAGDAIAVTVEQAGGSVTGAPTSEPILVIPTA
jgi:anti-sigma-K factor RskA